MRLIAVALAAAVLAMMAPAVRADEPAKFYLNDDGSVSRKEFTELKREVAELKQKLADVTVANTNAAAKAACPCGESCPCAIAAASKSTAPAPFAQAGERVTDRVCTKTGCQLVRRWVPASTEASDIAPVAWASPTTQASAAPASSCAGSSCQSSAGARTPWYPGKALGREPPPRLR